MNHGTGRAAGLQAVFLDRDGTLGGTGYFIHPRDFTPYPWAAEAIGRLRRAGLRIFALTNQARIALGQATEADFQAEFAALGLDGAYICPHRPEDGCPCRKPAPGLLLRAAAEHGLDLRRCAVVGDRGDSDMRAAAAVGALKVLVRTGWGEGTLGPYRHTWAGVEPDHVAADVLQAAAWLLARDTAPGAPPAGS